MRWKILSLCCLFVAFWQWYEVFGRATHIRIMIDKFGIGGANISAGIMMIFVFFIGTFLSLFVASVSFRRLKTISSFYRTCALTSMVLLISGALIWAGLIVSPLVEIAPR
ncbi:hypothetical protein JO972_16625 [Verrucomicrobiaceae bacterium 5K15]|uniref:Uncharacterized protein n=1 Tax=Oceaniferula flava TaxID=2800421 RepID=A0AAE2SE27_9BACT|nr:hypothetical protein [Oceaniferula flavus]MBK1856591.1 hypothetical protein [Oceaniferula flavus]MBM1137899.1 hypothetical protein [Oceaniferula flavus]